MDVVERLFHEGWASRQRVGAIIPLTTIIQTVDLVPVHGKAINSDIDMANSLELHTRFFLNKYSDKELYHTMMSS